MTAKDVSPVRYVPPRQMMGVSDTSINREIEVVDADPKYSSVPGSVDYSEIADVPSIHQAVSRPMPSNPVLDELVRRQDEALAAESHAPAPVTVEMGASTPLVEDLRPSRTPAQIAAAEKLAQTNRERAAKKRDAKAAKEAEVTPQPEKPAPAVTEETEEIF
ncbi:hypothetical protein SEA_TROGGLEHUMPER_65 [Rhodococcus phage Trogglehumper]|uniref:Uncharacterized protein n=1 Tax=Rhodococcus phage Trogglehumper TaxID=3038381 RepID=A0AAF0GPD0_9CAUD|nr:hypothetical protein SEA_TROGGLEHUMPER_65 [Rhodococcus phage Trogglehumper]